MPPAQDREGFRDARRRGRAGIHRLDEGAQARAPVEEACLVGPIEVKAAMKSIAVRSDPTNVA
jgi:hypothetical protein